jgi:type I restriction enzyme S subunit
MSKGEVCVKVPEGWIYSPIKDIAEIISGGTPRTSIAEYWDGNVIWVTPSDITSQHSKYLFTSEREITDEGLANSAATLLPKGTILLCTRATIGELSIAAKPVATNQGFKNLVCRKNYDNEFIYYAIQPLKQKMLEKAIGSTFLELSKNALGSIELFHPADKSEQQAIAEVLSDMDGYIDSLEKLIAKKKAIKQGAMQELLTGKRRLPGFTGEWEKKSLENIADIFKGQGLSKTKLSPGGKYNCILYGELFTTYSEKIVKIKSNTNFFEGVCSRKGDILLPGSTTTTGIDLARASVVLFDDVLIGSDINIIRLNEKNMILCLSLFY